MGIPFIISGYFKKIQSVGEFLQIELLSGFINPEVYKTVTKNIEEPDAGTRSSIVNK